ncbi:microcompartment protein PduM [Intestinirhabdus alba]|jgi:microcompartment protein PduM|uniref:Microcompartment protein PduM n=1 Tax=Intestinirhabdus alba TaxID=2899544 RepID=A0A6L6IN88_9ENTR|nr:microcompartment protein PduM [Intestinirhabdus alba]MTH47397.1 microcompartment protein PduM [Intestinirhabdus alba]
MNGELLQRIVAEVVSRLARRAESTATLSVAQLREADARMLICRHATLHVLQADLPLLAQLAEPRSSDAAARIVHEALAAGVRVRLSLQQRLLRALPLKALARLPLRLYDEQGREVVPHPDGVLSYADVARLSGGTLVLRRKCIVTALAREAAAARDIHIIKQE